MKTLLTALIGVFAFVLVMGMLPEKPKSEEELAQEMRLAEEQKRKGFHCLSAWDGSHRNFKEDVQASLREPSSFEHIETRITPVNDKGYHVLFMDFRARNGFGGMNLASASAVVKQSDCSHELLAIADE
ncbi:MAG: hypothetical protein AAF771_15480 [Pseudomonadota bacterium]